MISHCNRPIKIVGGAFLVCGGTRTRKRCGPINDYLFLTYCTSVSCRSFPCVEKSAKAQLQSHGFLTVDPSPNFAPSNPKTWNWPANHLSPASSTFSTLIFLSRKICVGHLVRHSGVLIVRQISTALLPVHTHTCSPSCLYTWKSTNSSTGIEFSKNVCMHTC